MAISWRQRLYSCEYGRLLATDSGQTPRCIRHQHQSRIWTRRWCLNQISRKVYLEEFEFWVRGTTWGTSLVESLKLGLVVDSRPPVLGCRHTLSLFKNTSFRQQLWNKCMTSYLNNYYFICSFWKLTLSFNIKWDEYNSKNEYATHPCSGR